MYRLSGLGANGTQDINMGVSAAGTALGATLSTTAGAAALSAIGLTSAAIPFIGPVVAGITLLISALGIGSGCGATCTASTNVVNQLEPYLKQNLTAAQQQQAVSGCLTLQEQQAALGNFDLIWNYVLQNCGKIPAPGGTQCIADRQRGGKWDWFAMYRDPISAMCVGSVSAGSSSPSVSLSPLALVAALAIAAVVLL